MTAIGNWLMGVFYPWVGLCLISMIFYLTLGFWAWLAFFAFNLAFMIAATFPAKKKPEKVVEDEE